MESIGHTHTHSGRNFHSYGTTVETETPLPHPCIGLISGSWGSGAGRGASWQCRQFQKGLKRMGPHARGQLGCTLVHNNSLKPISPQGWGNESFIVHQNTNGGGGVHMLYTPLFIVWHSGACCSIFHLVYNGSMRAHQKYGSHQHTLVVDGRKLLTDLAIVARRGLACPCLPI